MSDASGGSLRAILFALAANSGIALTKFGAAYYTGSGSMLAEAIHSVADAANQLLLLLGMRQARRPESAEHPLGHHRVVYYWSMIVALLLFFVGGAFSLYEGIQRLQHPHPVSDGHIALIVLGIAILLESVSLWGALREIRKVQAGRSFWRWFRETRQSELMVVAGEDIAALLGLMFAFVAIGTAMLTGNPLLDAFGSMAIGVLLMVVAIAVLLEIKAMIVGESAEPAVRAALLKHIESQPEVRHLLNVITLQWGEKLIVAVQAEMHDPGSAAALIDAVNRVEASIQAAFPQARWVFFEPDVKTPQQ